MAKRQKSYLSSYYSNSGFFYFIFFGSKMFFKGIFFRCQCEPSQAANPEASILLKENRSKFVQLAHNTVRFLIFC